MATLVVPDFAADRSALEAHAALVAADRAAEAARHGAVLWFGEILRRGLYRDLGYGSMPQYAKVALGFSASKTTDYMTLAQKLEALPAVRAELAAGRIGYTKAREVVKVATPRTDPQWAEAARTQSRDELAQRVRTVQAKAKKRASAQLELTPTEPAVEALARDVPVRVTLTFTPEQYARWEAAWEKLRKLGGLPADRAEALLDVLAGTIETTTHCAPEDSAASAPRGKSCPPVQIHAHQCPDCGRVEVDGRSVAAPEAARLQCDAAIAGPSGRNTTTIPPARAAPCWPATAIAASLPAATAATTSRCTTSRRARVAAPTTLRTSSRCALLVIACGTSGGGEGAVEFGCRGAPGRCIIMG